MTHHLLKLAGDGVFKRGDIPVVYTEADRMPYRTMTQKASELKVGESFIFPYIDGHPDMKPEVRRVRYYISRYCVKEDDPTKMFSVLKDFHKSIITIVRLK